jgi:hypothetical protein
MVVRPGWIQVGLLAWCSAIGLHCAPEEDTSASYAPQLPTRIWIGPPNEGLMRDAGTARTWQGAPCPAAGTPPASDPVPMTTVETSDPREVYTLSRLEPIGCRVAIAPVLHPDRVVTGLACASHGVAVRPSDHRLFYVDQARRLGAFRCDDCPETPIAFPASPCSNAADELHALLFAPDGRHAEMCRSGQWYDEQGAAIPFEGGHPMHLGARGTALMSDGVRDLATGMDLELIGFSPELAVAVRARDDGYWVATEGFGIPPELWHVNFDGTMQLEGRYRVQLSDPLENDGNARLDAEGRLIFSARDPKAWDRVSIVCRAIGGESVVLSQLTRDVEFVDDMGFQTLFTGP